jgi:prefoldin subunit 5
MAAIKRIEQNITALNITREWMEQHIQQVQKGLSSIEKRVGDHIQAIREKREAQDHARSA